MLKLNVSGITEGFEVSKSVLCSVPESELSKYIEYNLSMSEVSKKKNPYINFDRNVKIFSHLLDFLRNERTPFDFKD